MICKKCGASMDQTDKNTFTGRVIREYACRKCGHTDWEDDGVALWQALEDLQEKSEAKLAAQAADLPQCEPPAEAQRSPQSLCSRLSRLFSIGRSKRLKS